MAKQNKVIKNDEGMLFAGITKGSELRRNLLGCSKDILESLKKYEEFKSIKEKKLNLIHQFRQATKELSKSINMLKSQLPNIKEMPIQKPQLPKPLPQLKAQVEKKGKQEKPKTIKVEVEKPKEKTELEKLEEELNQIEEKLNRLS